MWNLSVCLDLGIEGIELRWPAGFLYLDGVHCCLLLLILVATLEKTFESSLSIGDQLVIVYTLFDC